MRVVLVGDSHVTDTSPHRQVIKLGPRLRRAGLDIVTVAHGGANSRDVLRQEIPGDDDWVVLSVGINDAAPWKTVPLDEFVTNCDAIMATAHQAHVLVLGVGPVAEHQTPGQRTNATLASYTAALKNIAISHSARFVSTAALLNDNDLADDGIHFNDSGYRKLAERVLHEFAVATEPAPASDEAHILDAKQAGRSRP